MKVCFGILSIGQTYLSEFERLFKPSVSAYCTRHKYDLKVFTDFIDPIRKDSDTISFQKCLVPDQLREYDVVVILDADIFIEKYAPPIHVLELNGKIGIVDEVAQSTTDSYAEMVSIGFVDHPKQYYSKVELDLNTDKILNTGVIICNPSKHADYLKLIYEKYVDKSVGHPRGFHYEQSCIGYELQKDGAYTTISNLWNFIYIHSQITKKPVFSYFLHFAGMRGFEREIALSRHTSKSGMRWGIKK